MKIVIMILFLLSITNISYSTDMTSSCSKFRETMQIVNKKYNNKLISEQEMKHIYDVANPIANICISNSNSTKDILTVIGGINEIKEVIK